MNNFVFDKSKCKKCGGDGKKAIPVKNVFRVQLLVDGGKKLVTPDYLVSIEDCECKINENKSTATPFMVGLASTIYDGSNRDID